MPNIKSAKKRVLVTKTKNEGNKALKTKVATLIKKFKTAINANDIATAKAIYSDVCSILDKAVSDNLFQKNYANRRKAHFAKLLSDKESA